ncbi:hypothetical protein PLUTE_b0092 [Pseudoalteromonas luteoviolacea DSM 6061]|nr:hypothetical protein [Pseudoalteromonas luteoviolacea DSM 6061]
MVASAIQGKGVASIFESDDVGSDFDLVNPRFASHNNITGTIINIYLIEVVRG